MRYFKGFNKYLAAAVSMIVASACAQSFPEIGKAGKRTVGFGLGSPQTKTQIDADHGTFAWAEGDHLALWARSSDGEWTLSNQDFSLLASGHGNVGYFTSELDSPMPQDSYTYYLAYPLPASVDGTRATFTVPAVQDGKASDGIDIILGGPVQSGALEAIDESLPVGEADMLDVRMRHLLHFLRFYIPQGSNALGEPVEKIEFTMPQAMAGSVTVDVTDGSAEFSAGGTGYDGRTVTMVLDGKMGESVNARYDYAAAGIYPPATAYGDGDVMEVTLYSQSKIGHVDPIRLAGRSFAAGHITSVPLRPTSVSSFYSATFALAANNLGEDVQNVTLTLPEGTSWPGTSSNVYTYSESDGFTVGESFRITTSAEEEFRALSGKTVSVRYESESAVVYETVSLGDLSAATRVEKDLHCPYLLFEDFSGVESFNSGDKHSASNVGDKDPYLFLDGWSIARAGGEAGKAVRMAAHREWFATYDSRCDSPMLSNLKDGKTVQIELTFNYSMGREEGGLGANPKLGATVHVGSTSTSGGIKSASTTGTFVESFNVNEESGSYDNVDNEHVTVISDMTNARRISWREVADGNAGTSNGTYWLYLDNIRVSIRK
ncbi:MAG: fimbrillin family protein [Bacteroidales bacterium]|nr:fimbrillin family protein [Bacteroidales bacterium]